MTSEAEKARRISQLAQTFPSIATHAAVIDWDPDALNRWAAVASHGEKLAVQLVLRVWNQWEDWSCGRFDVFEAYGVWDGEHWAAFQAWAEAPFTL